MGLDRGGDNLGLRARVDALEREMFHAAPRGFQNYLYNHRFQYQQRVGVRSQARAREGDATMDISQGTMPLAATEGPVAPLGENLRRTLMETTGVLVPDANSDVTK